MVNPIGILKFLKGLPSWVYLGGAAAAALGAGALWVSHGATSKQAAKDAPAIAAGTVATAAASLDDRQLQATNLRVSHEAATDTRTAHHVAAVDTAADDRAAFAEYLRGLHDAGPLPSPEGGLGGVQGGSGPQGAPPAAGRSGKR